MPTPDDPTRRPAGDAPDALSRRLDAAAGPAPDAEVALAALGPRLAAGPSRRPGRLLGVAAAVVLVAGGAWALAARSGDEPEVRAGPEVTSTTLDGVRSGPVTFEVLARTQGADQVVGDLRAATTAEELADLWADATARSGDPQPSVDLTTRTVVSFTVPDDACPPTLEGISWSPPEDPEAGPTLTPDLVEPAGTCEQPLIPRTFVVALDRTSVGERVGVGDRFTLALPDQPVHELVDRSLVVDREPQPTLSARVVLEATTVAAGGELAGTVVVHNGTGHQIEAVACGGLFAVTLGNDEVDGTPAFPSCAGPFPIPTGETSFPVTISATAPSCSTTPSAGSTTPRCLPGGELPPLAPGPYRATLYEASPTLPSLPEPLEVTVT